ncbi:MAG: hypothetical protein Q7S84_00340 [bacterium]|nr:hypothetical protein [bacterium]
MRTIPSRASMKIATPAMMTATVDAVPDHPSSALAARQNSIAAAAAMTAYTKPNMPAFQRTCFTFPPCCYCDTTSTSTSVGR